MPAIFKVSKPKDSGMGFSYVLLLRAICLEDWEKPYKTQNLISSVKLMNFSTSFDITSL